jgi:hypothetical protein
MENKGKDKESEKTICKAVWDDPKMTNFFCKLVVEEINAGNRPLGTLNERGYKSSGEKFFVATGKHNMIELSIYGLCGSLKSILTLPNRLWATNYL